MNKLILNALILLSFSSFLLACGQNELDTTLDDTPTTVPKFGPNFKFYTDSNLFFKTQTERTSEKSDPFSIKSVRREGDILFIDVKYSGGCTDHDFDIVWDGVVNLSSPEKVNLLLKHNSNGDHCEALVSNSVQIDLKSYFNNLVKIANTEFIVSNASSIQEVSSLSGISNK